MKFTLAQFLTLPRALRRSYHRAWLKANGAKHVPILSKISERRQWQRLNLFTMYSDIKNQEPKQQEGTTDVEATNRSGD